VLDMFVAAGLHTCHVQCTMLRFVAADAAVLPFVRRLRCGHGARTMTNALAGGKLLSKVLCFADQQMCTVAPLGHGLSCGHAPGARVHMCTCAWC
jgi:hypothetical protein